MAALTARPQAGESLTVLGPLEVHVWCRHTGSMDRIALGGATAALSIEERARADRFHFDHDRRDYIAAHDLLRRTLSRYGGGRPSDWAFEAEPGGRPRLRTGDQSTDTFTFSLSHTRGLVTCAVARGIDVGVDVERGDRRLDADDLGRTVLSAAEHDALRALAEANRPTRAVELWTLKEAFAKATGEGLSADLRAASFVMVGDDAVAFRPPEAHESGRWQFALFAPWPGHDARLAVAARTRVPSSLRMVAMVDDGALRLDRAVLPPLITPLRTSR